MAWNQPTSRDSSAARKASKSSPSLLKGLVAGLLVVVIGAGVAHFLLSGKDSRPVKVAEAKKPSQIAEVKPAAAPTNVVEVVDKAKTKRRAMLDAMTPKQRADFLRKEFEDKPLDLTPRTNQAFRTGTEQVMNWIFNSRLGNVPPPLPRLNPREMKYLAEILIADNPELETDSEKVKEAKKVVQDAKAEIREYIKQGGTIEDFLSYYHGKLMQAHNEWRECNKMVIDTCRNDPGIAQEFCRDVNKRLAEKGIKPVKLPVKLLEKQGYEVIEEVPSAPEKGDQKK